MVLLYADVDDLKKINDAYGHGAGDAALVRTAKIFKESFRSSDITARLGGDEFAVLALEASVPCSDMLKSRLEGKLQARLAEADFAFELSLSIGMILLRSPGLPFDRRPPDRRRSGHVRAEAGPEGTLERGELRQDGLVPDKWPNKACRPRGGP